MPSIRSYNTHVEVTPYYRGSCREIENMFSKYDPILHKRIPVAHLIQNNTLFLPKGVSLNKLAYHFRTTPTPINRSDPKQAPKEFYSMKTLPRDSVQAESIDFLLCQNRFVNGNYHTQFGLNLNTGEGKTFCMISALALLRTRAIIITHKTNIRDQWKKEFLDKTTINPNRICVITGKSDMDAIIKKEKDGDVYIVNQQTLSSYANATSWDDIHKFFITIEVGVKVVDEAHLFFRNTLLIDFFSNTARNYYLTATPGRNDPIESKLFDRAFANAYNYGENIEGRRRHTVFLPVFYRSRPDEFHIISICNKAHGFDSRRFIDYALTSDSNRSMEKVLIKIMKQISNLEGRVLITSPKIDSFAHIKEILESVTDKSIGIVHSKQSTQINNDARMCDIILATIKGFGVGDDIPGLRVVINLEPIASQGRIDQLRGRLREYNETDDTYMYHLVDEGIPRIAEMYRQVEPVMLKKCKVVNRLLVEV